MVEINRKKAEKLFHLNTTIVALPGGENPNTTTYRRLYLNRDFFTKFFPVAVLKTYIDNYKGGGKSLKFYVEPLRVFVRRTGNGFYITDANTRRDIRHVIGTDFKLVQHCNANLYSIVNAGYILPSYRKKILY